MKITKRIIIYILLLILYTACGGAVDTPTEGGGTDPTAPTVINNNPAADSSVPSPSSITVSFDEPIDLATVDPTTFIIFDSSVTALTALDGSWGLHSLTDTVIEFIPNGTLPDGITTITVTTGIADTAGNNFAADQSWAFTIAPSGDVTAPIFLGGDPTGTVTTACSITATFDEPIDSASVTDSSFQIIDSTSTTLTAVDGNWGVDPSSPAQIKFIPTSPLPIGTTNVTLTTAITDIAGNQAAPQAWSFTTTLPCAPTP